MISFTKPARDPSGARYVIASVVGEATDLDARVVGLYEQDSGWLVQANLRHKLTYPTVEIEAAAPSLKAAKAAARRWLEANPFPACCRPTAAKEN